MEEVLLPMERFKFLEEAYFHLLISKSAKNVGTDNHFHEICGEGQPL